MLRKLSQLAIALAASVAFSNASAIVIIIDDFNSPDQFIADQAGGGATAQFAAGGVPYNRYLSHELLAGPNNTAGSGSSVTIGSQAFPVGSLEVANANGRDSVVLVGWTIPNGLILDSSNGPASFLFNVLLSDGNPTSAGLFFNNNPLGSFVIPANTTNQFLAFNVTAAQQNMVNLGGNLELRLNGETGWDMSIDSLGVRIPEPASIALVGLALLAAGVASRRRKV